MKKIAKLCFHSSDKVKTSFHFDEFFSQKKTIQNDNGGHEQSEW